MRILQAFLFIALITSCSKQTIQGRVISVADGDTFTILVQQEQVKVRLHGIDAPEKGQDFSNVSREFLSDLVFEKEVEVQLLDRDRYGRTLGIVYAENTNVNEAMLKAGLAWHYKTYDNNPFWALLETEARQERKGLWALPNAEPPWEWRKKKRLKSEVQPAF